MTNKYRLNNLAYKAFVLFLFFAFSHIQGFADEKSFARVMNSIESIQDRIPNDDDFFIACNAEGVSLTTQEWSNIFFSIKEMQNAKINKDDILEIFNSKRNALSAFSVSYHVDDFPVGALNNDFVRQKFFFTFVNSKNKLYLFRDGARSKDDYAQAICSYDGSLLRLVKDVNGEVPNVDISNNISLGFFFQKNMPLVSMWLFDAQRCGAIENDGNDCFSFLQSRGACILQEKVTINGIPCLVMIDPVRRAYFAPELDYSLIRYEQFYLNYPEGNTALSLNSAAPVGRQLSFRRDLLDHRDKGNGFWVPSRVEDTYYISGQVSGRTLVSIEDVQINKRIPDDFFVDVIPENAFVFDNVRNITYFQREASSIDGLLQETVLRKTVTVFRWVSVIIGLAMISIAVGFKIRKRMLEGRSV